MKPPLLPRRTLLGRALSLLGGLAGVGREVAGASPPTLSTFFSISAEVPLDTSGETMPRFVDWGSETAIYRDGRVELFRVEGDRHKPPIECKKPRYKLVDGATGERVSTITGHRIMWADIDLGIYAHCRPTNDRESRRGGNRLRRIALVHRPGIRFGLQRPEDMDSGFPLSRAELVHARDPVGGGLSLDVHGRPHLVVGLQNCPPEAEA
jgi:hypothetical protein